MNTFDHLTSLVLQFRAERDWEQFHTPKELAISLVVESAELLELMQWKQGEELKKTIETKHEDIADELADCLHSLLLLAHDVNVNLPEALEVKLKKAAEKYPVEKVKGRAVKYTEL